MEHLAVSIYLLAVVFLLVAFFYSSVGLGGGSSYTALLALAGAGPQVIPMVSLALNLVVTTIGALVFLGRGHGRARLILPFLATSIPMAYVGGMLHLPRTLFYLLLMVSLLFAAGRIYFPGKTRGLDLGPGPRLALSLVAGALLGLVAGICGIGGGVYLVPLVILLGLGSEREAAACGAFFIWVNSLAGLAARLQFNHIDLVPFIPLAVAVSIGGGLGASLGAVRFSPRTMQRILGSILIVAVVFLARKIS